MGKLKQYLGSPVIGVAAAYTVTGCTRVYIGGVTINADNSLQVYFPKGHHLDNQQLLTLHLDNRTGVDEYDANLHVYRTSYKGRVAQIKGNTVLIEPIHFELIFGNKVVCSFNAETYQHAIDERPDITLPITPLTGLPTPDIREQENKIGVLVSHAEAVPHTTVLAFLSTAEDDIFFISFTDTFKSRVLRKDTRCHFAIDSRAVFTYTNAIEWNYSIVEADAYSVPREHPLYEPVREQFIHKNPWEVGFFMAPNVEMFHLKPRRVILPI